MKKKLQIKLSSQSGELLKVVTCFAGQISVLRANTLSDLRPYQRALAGTSSKERLSISVDGAEYNSEHHTLIGFGEPMPLQGKDVRTYFASLGIEDSVLVALCNSVGLEGCIDKPGSSLSADEERRVRIIAATCTPSKILILNEPFETITSQWREQFAELLIAFARDQNGLVVVTGLSYRPECWIDNDVVARVLVGESIQRTVGFAGAGSQLNSEIDKLRNSIREESSTGGSPAGVTAVASAALSSTLVSSQIDDPTIDFKVNKSSHITSAIDRTLQAVSTLPSTMVAGIGVSGALTTCLALYLATRPEISQTTTSSTQSTSPIKDLVTPNPDGSDTAGVGVQPPSGTDQSTASLNEPKQPASNYILDGYPTLIRTSLIETVQGIISTQPVSAINESQGTEKAKNSGNLFKLLESASNSPTEKSYNNSEEYAQPAPAYESSPQESSWQESTESSQANEGEEQQRREAIRQKFLDAIRAAAEKRQTSGE